MVLKGWGLLMNSDSAGACRLARPSSAVQQREGLLSTRPKQRLHLVGHEGGEVVLVGNQSLARRAVHIVC